MSGEACSVLPHSPGSMVGSSTILTPDGTTSRMESGQCPSALRVSRVHGPCDMMHHTHPTLQPRVVMVRRPVANLLSPFQMVCSPSCETVWCSKCCVLTCVSLGYSLILADRKKHGKRVGSELTKSEDKCKSQRESSKALLSHTHLLSTS